MHILRVRLWMLVVLVLSSSACRPQPALLDGARREKIVNAASRLLEERYVFPDVGKKCGEHIRVKLEAGAFDGIEDPAAFAHTLTEELQSISRDKHMRVRLMQRQRRDGLPADPAVERYRIRRRSVFNNYGFTRAEVLEGNVGYLEVTGFPPVELARPTAEAAMKFLENVDALVIDIRRNGGGNPATIQLLCSYFFGEKTHLNSLYWREGDRTQEFWTLDSINGRRRPDLPLFVLTSRFTFSGGEEFAYNLKTRKRATLIGETTGGGANGGGMFPLDPPITIFIPTGRAINPVTGDNWEGKGVEPEIKADSAAALEIAVPIALKAAQERRQATEHRIAVAAAAFTEKVRKAEQLFGAGTTAEGRALLAEALDEARGSDLADEIYINQIGYEYLGKAEFDMAVEVFSYNVRSFPESWNVYDSLGEAYMKRGDRELAIQYYRKSVEMNPANDGGKAALRQLGVED